MPVKPRKIPMRMCVACREMKPKKELIRIVRTPEGPVEADLTGKKNGRGAYLCRSAECLETAWKRKSFNRAFQQPVSKEVYEALREELGGLEG